MQKHRPKMHIGWPRKTGRAARQCGRLTLPILALLLDVAWTRPQSPSKATRASTAAQKLDFMVVLVNGQPRLVKGGEEFSAVRGDTVVIKEAVLGDPALKVRTVHLVGYEGPRHRQTEDRGYPLATAKLVPKYSEGGKDDTYAIVAQSRSVLHGAVYLHLIDPVLKYAEIAVNGKSVVMRAGELLTVKPSDQLKVDRVVTNLEGDSDVLFQIVPAGPTASPGVGTAQAGEYAIHFSRGGRVFAAVPLVVRE